jgi:hypothetical protein
MPTVTVGRENSGDTELYYEDHGSGRQPSGIADLDASDKYLRPICN